MDSVLRYFDTLLGLPVHPTVVHFLVVAGTGISVVVLWRLARKRKVTRNLIWAALFGLIAAFISVLSGEALATRVGYEQIERLGHDSYGTLLLILTFAQLVLLLLLRWWDAKRRRRNTWARSLIVLLLSVTSLLVVGATLLAMHTGTQAVWQGDIAHTDFGTYDEAE